MTPEEQEDRKDTLELINSELAARMARQSDSMSKIDTKAVFLVGFVATAAQFLASHDHQPVIAALAFVAYAVAFVFGVLIFHLADFEDVVPRTVLDENARSPKSQALMQLAATRVGMFEKNKEQHDRKAERWTVSLSALAVGFVLSTVALVAHT